VYLSHCSCVWENLGSPSPNRVFISPGLGAKHGQVVHDK
jgi:hypothetical protein